MRFLPPAPPPPSDASLGRRTPALAATHCMHVLGAVLSSQDGRSLDACAVLGMQAIDRRERLRRLALETIDLTKDPYFMRNHLGQYECRLCLTLHNNEGNYLAHTQVRLQAYPVQSPANGSCLHNSRVSMCPDRPFTNRFVAVSTYRVIAWTSTDMICDAAG